MKKLIFFIIILLVLANRLATSGILTKERRKLPEYIDAQKRHSAGVSVPLRWAPEVKAWEDRVGLPLQGAVDPNISIKQRSLLQETGIPQEPATILYFEVDGAVYYLLPQTYEDIEGDPDIDDPRSFIQDVLLDPFHIIRQTDRWIYYKMYQPSHRYEVVVVNIGDGEIETAYVSYINPQRPE